MLEASDMQRRTVLLPSCCSERLPDEKDSSGPGGMNIEPPSFFRRPRLPCQSSLAGRTHPPADLRSEGAQEHDGQGAKAVARLGAALVGLAVYDSDDDEEEQQ